SSCPYPFIFSLNRIVLKIFLGIRKLGDVKGEVDFVKISLFLSLVMPYINQTMTKWHNSTLIRLLAQNMII
ncbi:MAG: hypothetical protein IKT96_01375, partial [Paludibacteraceae bacterium]|nr:hypothetical protein [Paludibacteraceae bacterium]